MVGEWFSGLAATLIAFGGGPQPLTPAQRADLWQHGQKMTKTLDGKVPFQNNSSANCFSAALIGMGIHMPPIHITGSHMSAILNQCFTKLHQPNPGDIAVLMTPNNSPVHAVTVLDNGQVFTKNGMGTGSRYQVTTMAEVQSVKSYAGTIVEYYQYNPSPQCEFSQFIDKIQRDPIAKEATRILLDRQVNLNWYEPAPSLPYKKLAESGWKYGSSAGLSYFEQVMRDELLALPIYANDIREDQLDSLVKKPWTTSPAEQANLRKQILEDQALYAALMTQLKLYSRLSSAALYLLANREEFFPSGESSLHLIVPLCDLNVLTDCSQIDQVNKEIVDELKRLQKTNAIDFQSNGIQIRSSDWFLRVGERTRYLKLSSQRDYHGLILEE